MSRHFPRGIAATQLREGTSRGFRFVWSHWRGVSGSQGVGQSFHYRCAGSQVVSGGCHSLWFAVESFYDSEEVHKEGVVVRSGPYLQMQLAENCGKFGVFAAFRSSGTGLNIAAPLGLPTPCYRCEVILLRLGRNIL